MNQRLWGAIQSIKGVFWIISELAHVCSSHSVTDSILSALEAITSSLQRLLTICPGWRNLGLQILRDLLEDPENQYDSRSQALKPIPSCLSRSQADWYLTKMTPKTPDTQNLYLILPELLEVGHDRSNLSGITEHRSNRPNFSACSQFCPRDKIFSKVRKIDH